MKKEELKHFGQLLEMEISKVTGVINCLKDTIVSNGSSCSHCTENFAATATDSEELQREMFTVQKACKYLDHLIEALQRTKDETYGICRECEKPISRDRLEILPHATMCIKCKSKEEEAARSHRGTVCGCHNYSDKAA